MQSGKCVPNESFNFKGYFFYSTGGGGYFPTDTVLTYEIKLVDTHNAMDGNGAFHAPFAGSYGFIFHFQSHYRQVNVLYARHNGNRFVIHYSDAGQNAEMDATETVYFALYLNPGETVQIDTGSTNVAKGIRAKFMGFLLSKA